MGGMTQTELVNAAEVVLSDTGNATWDAADLQSILQNVVLPQVQKRFGRKNRTGLAVTQYTRNVDVSGLTDLQKILYVEYPPADYPPTKREYRFLTGRDEIELNLRDAPSITSGTLTGTVTFTTSSRAVTGVGTAFSTELSEGDFIGFSSESLWYRVAKIASDTSLTLEDEFLGTGGADTEDATKYRSRRSVVWIHWRGPYTIGADASNAPAELDEVFIAGIIAFAMLKETRKTTNIVNLGENVASIYLKQVSDKVKRYRELLEGLEPIEDDIDGWYPRGETFVDPSEITVWDIG